MTDRDNLQEEITKAREEGQQLKAAGACSQAGQRLLDQKDYLEAVPYFQEASQLYGVENDKLGQAKALNQLGICLLMTGQASDALEPLDQALACLDGLPHPSIKAAVQGNLGLAYSALEDYRAAFKAHKTVLEEAEGRADQPLRLHALINLADCRMQERSFQSAQGFALVALDLAKELGQRSDLAVVYDLLGMISARSGDLKTALEYHQRAFQEAQQGDDLLRQGIALANQGLALEGLTELQQAADALGKAEQIFLKTDAGYLEKTRSDLERVRRGLG